MRATLALALLLVPAQLAALWSVLPAPTLPVWYLAALANEERGLLAAFLGLGAGLAVRTGRRATVRSVRRLALAVAVVSAAAALLVLVREARVVRAALAAGVDLAPTALLVEPWRAAPQPILTATFAEVEGRALELDLFAPTRSALDGRGAPLVVRVHGGSWAFGARDESPHWTRWWTERGAYVAAVDYRLTPPPRWRDATQDVLAAVRWCRREAVRLGVDPDRIVLFGASAGGHLALLAAHGVGAPEFAPGAAEGRFDELDVLAVLGARVAAVVALSPPVVLGIGFESPRPPWYPAALRRTNRVEELLGGTPDEVPELYRVASPITHVHANSPPTFLAHGADDRLVWPANSERLAARLVELAVPHELLLLPATEHLFERRAGGFATQLVQARLERFMVERGILDAALPAPAPR
jgi:acetyl esterase/lipase